MTIAKSIRLPKLIGHLAGVHELEASSFKDPFPPYFIDQLANANLDTFLVALEDGRIVGYAVVDNWTDHQHLVSLAVSTGSRRKGAGQALLDNMILRLRDGPLRLELRKATKRHWFSIARTDSRRPESRTATILIEKTRQSQRNNHRLFASRTLGRHLPCQRVGYFPRDSHMSGSKDEY